MNQRTDYYEDLEKQYSNMGRIKRDEQIEQGSISGRRFCTRISRMCQNPLCCQQTEGYKDTPNP